MTYFEQTEILSYRNIYYIAAGVNKLDSNPKKTNNGFDDDRNDYILVKKDQIAYRYEIIEILGRGSYGQVVKVFDHKEKTFLALKIIRNLSCIMHQAKIEIKILYKLLFLDDRNKHVIHILDHFIFRNHICLTFELLDMNLYQVLKLFGSISSPTIKNYAQQLLLAIQFYNSLGVLHCDLKPENIMITEDKNTVKIIDFGSGCFENKRVFTYIQSRYYRAPEVILEIGYDYKIDIWSLGCVLAELYIGKPIFTGKDEIDQFICFMEVLGLPPPHFFENSSKRHVILECLKKASGSPSSKFRVPGSKSLKGVIGPCDPVFLDFISSNLYAECFCWDPSRRISADEALNHEWFSKQNLTQVTSLPVLKLEKQLNSSLSQQHTKKTNSENQSNERIKKKKSFNKNY